MRYKRRWIFRRIDGKLVGIMTRQAKSYSMVDHHLLHGGYLRRLTHKAMALYLFLTVVADREGRSFYSQRSVANILRMDDFELNRARRELVNERLIDYQQPYWRVLTLTCARKREADLTHPSMIPLIRQVLENSAEANSA